MHDELHLSPFERRIVGCRGIVLRHNRGHVDRSVTAIQRRSHPAWSSLRSDYRVTARASELSAAVDA